MTQNDTIDLAALIADAYRREEVSTWAKICPDLSISDGRGLDSAGDLSESLMLVPEEEAKRRRDRLVSHGYVLVDECMNTSLVEKVRQGIQQLQRQNLPASFVLMFDETWELAMQSRKMLESATHSRNAFNFDLLAWFIPLGEGGFSPHRDRQPDDAASSFHADQQAKFVTQWIALSDATPENSCLYMIPKPYDPGYTKGDTEEEGDPLQRALKQKQTFQHIRAMPRKAGQSILFTHRIIHWGSKGDAIPISTTGVQPRIAISFVCSDPDFEAPLLVHHAKYFPVAQDKSSECQLPPLRIRLLLICAQLLIYYQRFDLDKRVVKACYEYCKLHQNELEESYRNKVFLEFVKAMKEHETEDINGKILSSEAKTKTRSDIHAGDNDENDDEDAVLEEMLNAEAGGYGEFEDDYDEMEDEIHREEQEKMEKEDREEEEEVEEWEEEMEDSAGLFGKHGQGGDAGSSSLPTKKAKTSS
jgi:Phytanoyl-CoA dioxygenase (PhyH)